MKTQVYHFRSCDIGPIAAKEVTVDILEEEDEDGPLPHIAPGVAISCESVEGGTLVGHLPPLIVFHKRSSSTYHDTLEDLIFVRTVHIPNLSLLLCLEVF